MRTLNELNTKGYFSTKVSFSNSHKLLIGALALIFVAGMTSSAYALTIDDFTTGTINFLVDSGTPNNSGSNDGLPLLETIGGTRNATGVYGVGGSNVQAMVNPPTGVMAWSAGSGTLGNLTLTYNGTGGNSGLGGVDLTLGGAGNHILVNMTDADKDSTVSVRLTDTNGFVCSLEEQTTIVGQQLVKFQYANFNIPANCENVIDFTSINTIELQIIGLIAGDYEITLIGVPQIRVGGTVGSMDTATLLVAGAQANMGLWSLALVGAVAVGAVIIYKKKSSKTEQ